LRPIELAVVLSLLAAAAGVWALARRRRLQDARVLRDFALRVAEGRFEPRLPAGSGGELGALEAALAKLAEKAEGDQVRTKALEQLRRDFVANVSHELRTPLTAIQGFAETLLDGALEDPEHRREFVEDIARNAEMLKKLIDDLLTLSAIESKEAKLDFRPLRLSEVWKRVLPTLSHQAITFQVSLAAELPDSLPPVVADPDKLGQVFLNLVANAVKYNQPGGSVTVRASEDHGHVRVSVSDTGIGIPEEDLPRLFERFYRVDKGRSRDLGGTGLGLSIVKHIVEAHQGSVSVESVQDQGSVFSFTLPKVQSPR